MARDLSWRDFLDRESSLPYRRELSERLLEERARFVVYPEESKVFAALEKSPLEKTKVVILGQDPYHGDYLGIPQATGLAFSVPSGVPPPPSLGNIFKELSSNLQIEIPKTGDLTPWAYQGVLLLNTLLTVRKGEPLSHRGIGWEIFIDHLLEFLLQEGPEICFFLWGRQAQKMVFNKSSLIDPKKHLLLRAAHPSPLSAQRGFFGSGHFYLAQEWLKEKARGSIDWNLPSAKSLEF